jgi:hypothetical protein
MRFIPSCQSFPSPICACSLGAVSNRTTVRSWPSLRQLSRAEWKAVPFVPFVFDNAFVLIDVSICADQPANFSFRLPQGAEPFICFGARSSVPAPRSQPLCMPGPSPPLPNLISSAMEKYCFEINGRLDTLMLQHFELTHRYEQLCRAISDRDLQKILTQKTE